MSHSKTRAEIITIGDEILRGEIVDSNKALMAERLLSLDIETDYQTSVRDIPADMEEAFRRAISRCEVVLVSGGLGPTRDDLTAAVVAETFDRELRLDAASLEQIRSFFARLGREMAKNNETQAWFPSGADVLENPIGTAPGFAIEESDSIVFCMPGVPRELSKMLDEQVLPRLEARRAARGGGGLIARTALLRTFGMGESTLDNELSDIAREDGVELGFRTTFPDNLLRPCARASSAALAEERLAGLVASIRQRLGALVYAEGEERMEAVVGRLLREGGETLATAESCTGGLIAEKLTAIPGSSEYFLGGVVAYANEAKQALLGVPEALLIEHGAVSEPVARAMAEGVRTRFGADIGIATTGISGPGGGTDEKPVGLVYVALSRGDTTHVDRFLFALDRTRHRELTAQTGLDWVRRALLGLELIAPALLARRGGGPPPGAAP